MQHVFSGAKRLWGLGLWLLHPPLSLPDICMCMCICIYVCVCICVCACVCVNFALSLSPDWSCCRLFGRSNFPCRRHVISCSLAARKPTHTHTHTLSLYVICKYMCECIRWHFETIYLFVAVCWRHRWEKVLPMQNETQTKHRARSQRRHGRMPAWAHELMGVARRELWLLLHTSGVVRRRPRLTSLRCC